MFSFRRDPDAECSIGVAFSDRHGGSSLGPRGALNFGGAGDDPRVLDNVAALSEALSVDKLMVVSQVHGRDVMTVTPDRARDWRPEQFLGGASTGQPALPTADAVVADRGELGEYGAGLAIAVRVADCLPVVLIDQHAQVMAVAHAGRVGLLAGVLPATVSMLRAHGAADIAAWIGPHVCGRCYEVPQAMFDEATAKLPALACRTTQGTPGLDLAAAAISQLDYLDVSAVQVGGCTLTDPDLHSYRADGAESGRLIGLAWFGR